jgi:hypothetical protein
MVQIGKVPNRINQSFEARNRVIRRIHAEIVARICGVSSILLPSWFQLNQVICTVVQSQKVFHSVQSTLLILGIWDFGIWNFIRISGFRFTIFPSPSPQH